MVEFYVVMSFPLGAFFTFIIQRIFVVKGLTTAVVVFLIWLNLFQHQQYRTSLLHWNSMSKEAYWGIWVRQSWPEGYDKMLIHLDAEKAKKGEDAFPKE